MERDCLLGIEFLFGMMKFLEIDGDDGCTAS